MGEGARRRGHEEEHEGTWTGGGGGGFRGMGEGGAVGVEVCGVGEGRADGLCAMRWTFSGERGHDGRMRKASLREARGHLSALVDAAEHRRERTVIVRHGKPVAAIVPVAVGVPEKHRLSGAEIEALFAELGRAEPQRSAVEDSVGGRR